MSDPRLEWSPSNCVTIRFDNVTINLDYHMVARLAYHFVTKETTGNRADILHELNRQANL